jgi:hypothetical protein
MLKGEAALKGLAVYTYRFDESNFPPLVNRRGFG